LLSDATKKKTATPPRHRHVEAEEETSFASFIFMNSIDAAEASRFLDCVKGCGGGEHTDCLTLAKLYDIWRALGRDGRDGDYDDDEQRALRDVTRIWCRGVVRGELSTEVRR
jgi:hypothetical protein